MVFTNTLRKFRDEVLRHCADERLVFDLGQRWNCPRKLLGGENFRLGQFHDDLIKNGSLPVSVVEWVLLDDPTAIQQALK